ncbi:MAG: DUF3558 domain-containing protein [Thermocrispum sp.]
MAVLTLASCSDKDGGNGLPGDPNTPPPVTQPSAAPSTAPAQGGELEKIKACDLLTDDEAATISKGFAAEDTGPGSGASSSCGWDTSIDRGIPIDKHISLGINIRPWQSVDEYFVSSTGKVTDGDVEGRKAKQVAENGGEGTCELAFAAEAGRVDVTVSTKQIERACEIAGEVSTLIEPKLPEPTA